MSAPDVLKLLEAAAAALQPRELEVELEEPAPQPERAAVRSELVKVHLLAMRLPSRYLLQSVRFVAVDGGVEEVRRWEGERARLAKRLETVRRRAYALASRVFAFVEEYGTWIAVSEEALAEAERISKYVREELAKLGLSRYADRYRVRAVSVYLEPEEAEELLQAAIDHLSEDVEELEAKIEVAEKTRAHSSLQRLERDRRYREALLKAFKDYLASVLGKR